MANQGKLLKKYKVPLFVVRLELTLVNRNQWIKKYLFIAISFYRNIVCQSVNKALI